MSIDPDPFDEIANSAAYLFDAPNATGYSSSRLSNEPSNHWSTGSDRDTTRTLTDLRKQVQTLSHQLAEERLLNQKLLALNEFAGDLETAPDPERMAHGIAKTLYHLFQCALVCVFSYHPAEQRYKLMSSAGSASSLVSSTYQPDVRLEIIQNAIRTQSVLSNKDIQESSSALVIGEQRFPSLVVAPLITNGALRGMILLADPSEYAFTSGDTTVVKAASEQMLTVWEYARQNETLTEFVQTVTMMSVIQEAPSLMEMIASIARRTLGASYTIVATRNQQEWVMRGSGRAPRLLQSLQVSGGSFLEEAVKAAYTFRLRDLRNEPRADSLQLDSPELCMVMACPIRMNGDTNGILLAFGKIGGESFTDSDVFLAELLVAHAAVNLESCALNQEVRASLKTTQLLYDLSLNISQAASLTDAAYAIGRTAYRLLQARKCGLILFSADGQIEAEVRFPADDPEVTHPYRLIQQSMDSRQTIYLADNNELSLSATPIQTLRRCYGALWIEFSEDNDEIRHPAEEIRILINQAAVALERSILLEETRQQANEIARAYHTLEGSYEDLLSGLTKALDVRDSETEGHSERVMKLSVQMGIDMGLPRSDLQALKRGALLHDIGKIGVPDGILLKRGPLDDQEWEKMREHPQKGADIIGKIPALEDALPVIAFHQERWDGSGYPLHLRSTEIPLLARIFAVIDVYDALTSNRPYRSALSSDEALEYLEKQAGHHFDPDVVTRFTKLVKKS